MRLTHLGLSSPISIHFVFVHAQSSLFTGGGHVLGAHHLYMGLSSSMLSLVVTVAVLGAWLSFVVMVAVLGSVLSFVGSMRIM